MFGRDPDNHRHAARAISASAAVGDPAKTAQFGSAWTDAMTLPTKLISYFVGGKTPFARGAYHPEDKTLQLGKLVMDELGASDRRVDPAVSGTVRIAISHGRSPR